MNENELVLEDKIAKPGPLEISRSVSFNKELLDRIKKFTDSKGYSRSELVRFAVIKVLEANGF
ncbi:hypothetical protein LCGC14_1877650 [marine sediment metagenome]|uniref:Ribbon-helix-helix protein CopG domain-containing protein n=1 Tax=marine sediment metagenome TaxID=412755 RepID=A0A0F9G370_9ZZZZ